MKRATLGILVAVASGGCVHTSSLEKVRAGMSPDEVVAVMGQPESSIHSPGRSCSVYTVMKDFWSRTPWSVSDRYYVCFTDGKVDTFGRADQLDVKTSQRQ
jgi:hypothetical protein